MGVGVLMCLSLSMKYSGASELSEAAPVSQISAPEWSTMLQSDDSGLSLLSGVVGVRGSSSAWSRFVMFFAVMFMVS